MQPEFYSSKRASKQSTSYILRKPVPPLIWTALIFSRPFGTELGNGVLTHELKAVFFTRFPQDKVFTSLHMRDHE